VRGRELPGSATPDLVRTAERARERLGEQAYGAAFDEGRAVPSSSVLDRCQEVFGAMAADSRLRTHPEQARRR
jgi:hypothetical protein